MRKSHQVMPLAYGGTIGFLCTRVNLKHDISVFEAFAWAGAISSISKTNKAVELASLQS
jgi:hypothetical protein